MQPVPLPTLPLDRFAELMPRRAYERLREALALARRLLEGRAIWHLNSTRTGGGVAEMLCTQLAYERGAGLEVGWLVLEAEPAFFTLTKRLHHLLHGEAGDGGRLGPAERELYEAVARAGAERALGWVRPRDLVVLHDPQTAGLAPWLARAGRRVIWRCHIGCEHDHGRVRAAWEFLRPYL